MNCKQGDLAIVVRSSAGNEGRIVRCLRLQMDHGWVGINGAYYETPTWSIDVELVGWCGDKSKNIADSQLRPIRDPGDDAQDETLSWLPVPLKEHA